jgi:hypothetical protein
MTHWFFTRPDGRLKTLTITIVSLWFIFALICSLLGVFGGQNRPPFLLGGAAILPLVAFAIWYHNSAAFRHFVLGADLRILTLAQTWRVGAIVFLILYYQRVLPGSFALPAGWGDIAIGITAPFVAWAISSGKTFSRQVAVLWNALGMLDLIMAVTLGVLSSPTPLGILAGDVTTQAMGQFPLSLVPTFFVPLLFILHLISLGQIRSLRAQQV